MTVNARSGAVRELHAVLRSYPHTKAIKEGRVESPTIRLNFTEIDPIFEAFAPMVREQAYDVSELALVTFLQARAAHKPVLLLPVVVAGQFHHSNIWYNADRGHLRPEDLEGRRIGVRSYGQTTGLWVRAILQEDFGVRPERVTWVTIEGAHVAEYVEPANVERTTGEHGLRELLRSGEIDAAIVGPEAGAGFAPLIPNPEKAALAWYERHGVVPINHMVAVTESVVQDDPQAVQELYELLAASCAVAEVKRDASGLPEPKRVGIENVRAGLELAARYAVEQELIPDVPDIDDFFPADLVDR